MAEPTRSLQAPLAETRASEQDYKRLSGLAVLACVVAGIYIVALLCLTFVSANKHGQLISNWLLLPPAAAWAMAVMARLNIQRSEGILTGASYAAVAWWMSILGGGGYAVYMLANGFAVRQQSGDFGMAWYNDLRDNKIGAAYAKTVDPGRRSVVPIDDPARLEKEFNDYPYFLGSPTVRIFERCGKDVEVVHQGAVKWEEDPNTGTYRVDHIYWLRCPEGVYEQMLPLISPKVKQGQRGWQIPIHETAPRQKVATTYGRMIHELEDEGAKFARLWLERYSGHEPFDFSKTLAGAYSLTFPEPEQKQAEEWFMRKRAIAAVTGAAGGEALPLGPPFPIAKSDTSEPFEKLLFTKLAERKFFQVTGKPMSQGLENTLQTAWAMRYAIPTGGQRADQRESSPLTLVTDTAVEVTVPIEWGLTRTPPPPTSTLAKLRVVSTVPKLVENLKEARARGKENPDQADPTPYELLRDQPPREWRVIALESRMEAIAPPTRQKN